MDKVSDLHQNLIGHGVEFVDVSQAERRVIAQRWRTAFAPRVEEEPDISGYRDFRWHAFSYCVSPCLEGTPAFAAYLSQWQAPFYIINESLSFCALCRSATYPDLSALGDDLYVAHHNMKWTMVFTHEQPHLGPFFALRGQVDTRSREEAS